MESVQKVLQKIVSFNLTPPQTCAQNDDAVLQRLHSALDAAPDEELLALSGCSGCRRCGAWGGEQQRPRVLGRSSEGV